MPTSSKRKFWSKQHSQNEQEDNNSEDLEEIQLTSEDNSIATSAVSGKKYLCFHVCLVIL